MKKMKPIIMPASFILNRQRLVYSIKPYGPFSHIYRIDCEANCKKKHPRPPDRPPTAFCRHEKCKVDDVNIVDPGYISVFCTDGCHAFFHRQCFDKQTVKTGNLCSVASTCIGTWLTYQIFIIKASEAIEIDKAQREEKAQAKIAKKQRRKKEKLRKLLSAENENRGKLEEEMDPGVRITILPRRIDAETQTEVFTPASVAMVDCSVNTTDCYDITSSKPEDSLYGSQSSLFSQTASSETTDADLNRFKCRELQSRMKLLRITANLYKSQGRAESKRSFAYIQSLKALMGYVICIRNPSLYFILKDHVYSYEKYKKAVDERVEEIEQRHAELYRNLITEDDLEDEDDQDSSFNFGLGMISDLKFECDPPTLNQNLVRQILNVVSVSGIPLADFKRDGQVLHPPNMFRRNIPLLNLDQVYHCMDHLKKVNGGTLYGYTMESLLGILAQMQRYQNPYL